MMRMKVLFCFASLVWAYSSMPAFPPMKAEVATPATANASPNQRMEDLMNISEDIGQIHWLITNCDYRNKWFTDQPTHLTPIRVHGGFGP